VDLPLGGLQNDRQNGDGSPKGRSEGAGPPAEKLCQICNFDILTHFRASLYPGENDKGTTTWCGPSGNLECRSERCCMASSSGRQPKFAALNRGRHLCSAGRPSGWALAHILVFNYKMCRFMQY